MLSYLLFMYFFYIYAINTFFYYFNIDFYILKSQVWFWNKGKTIKGIWKVAKMNEAKFVIYFCYFSFYLYGAVYRAGGGGLELRSPEVQSIYAGDTIRLF